jgi:hypothetical protein
MSGTGLDTMTVAISDEATALTTGTAKLTMRAPYTMRLARAPRATLTTASTSGLVTVDMNVSAASVFSTTLTIDANEKTSTTAATAAVLSSTLILFDDEITFDIDAAGTGAKGLKVTLFFSRVR